MLLIKKNKNYYLRKIQYKEMSLEEVATLFNISLEKVNEEYVKFVNRKNPFSLDNENNSFKYTKIQTIISVVSSVISVISLIALFLTLNEMKEERNASLRPNLSFGTSQIIIAWNSDGSTKNLNEELLESISYYLEDDSIVNRLPSIKMFNIGVGTAKNVHLKWNNEENVKEFNFAFKNNNVSASLEIENYHMKVITENNTMYSPVFLENYYDFILNSKQDSISIAFPLVYEEIVKILFTESYVEFGNPYYLPCFSFEVSYSDIQNKKYSQTLRICFRLEYSVRQNDRSGFFVGELFCI